ncbi:MAG: hypothetical protein DMD45_11290 [Gemmatimonadetes bacterium]|nr:MAG: hypothetical protein DMD45_11290 [Gemmatimonadota bacterium]
MKLWIGLALLAGPLAAQSARARLEGRVPGAAVPVLDSLVQRAVAEGLPTEPLIQKALEGGAKQVTASRIVAAVQLSLGQLRAARDLLIRAGDEPPVTPGEVTTVAWALRRDLPDPVVQRVVAALPRPPRASAMHAVADLAAHQFDPDSAADLIIAAIGQGLVRERLLDVSAAAAHELQRGHTHAEALALVRQQLPNVPPSPKPTRSAVARARRPAAPPPP